MLHLVRTRAIVSSIALLGLASCGGDDVPPGTALECGGGEASEVCEVFRLVNAERASAGLPAYEWNAELAIAAQRHAVDMVENDYFSHESQDGRSFSDRADQAGYDAFATGENIAAGQRTPEQVMDSWMGSDGHRANILSDGSNEIGVGLSDFHWVQVFGHRD
ncbi:CAP domain-containing protein [Sandaracinus amylolyticus]|uniref:SCP domain-containing protein n=1 Tax=Sandaracinus amylolyticus TaxID=927083 RepID=A0A0F6W9S4_9BACT|nr:CAP domain-containing protein [Sandaracinus amylolyticus]AKF11008.1 hypothetical protein DB32_008157 [Sandaracinus amylolyticus]